MIIFFLFVLFGSLIAGRILFAEWRKSHSEFVVVASSVESKQTDVPSLPAAEGSSKAKGLSHWEIVIAQKNAHIEKLLVDLDAQKSQTREFEKIKSLLEHQIFESRELNRSIRKELELLRLQYQKSQEEITKLNIELNYKNQLIHQNEVKMFELRNRISGVLPNTISAAQKPAESNNLEAFSFDQLDWRKKLSE